MKLLLHSKVFYPSVGGIEQVSLSLAESLSKQGVDVTVLTDTPLEDHPEVDGYRVVRGATRLEQRELVRKADLVHSNGFSLQLLPSCVLYRRPLIWTHASQQASCLISDGRHEGQPCGHRWWRCFRLTRRQQGIRLAVSRSMRLFLRRFALHWAARNVCVTEWVRRSIRAPRSIAIWNPVEIRLTEDVPKTARPDRFMFIGRLVTEKGIATLLRALALCRQRGRDFGLDIFGGGPDRQRLEALSRELDLEAAVAFHGVVQGPRQAEALASAWIVVVPSEYEEPMGLVAVAAMAAGKPLIVSQYGGLAEVSEGCSLTFENGNPDHLAVQMMRLADDSALRESLAGRAGQQAQQFDPDRVARNYLSLYREVVGPSVE